MLLTKELGASRLMAKSDSLLVTGQVSNEFQAKDPLLARYLEFVRTLSCSFAAFKLLHVPREQNSRADLLSKLASRSKPGQHRSVIRETLITPRVSAAEMPSKNNQLKILSLVTNGSSNSWMTPYVTYLADGVLPQDPSEAQIIKKNAAKYTMIDGKLFRYGFCRPLLICVKDNEASRIMAELHEGICGSHIGGRALGIKIICAGYYCPTLRQDCQDFARKCAQCQKHSDWHRAPPRSYIQ